MKEMEKLKIFKRLFEFSKWLLNHTSHFPKSHRFSVAVKMENSILELIELVTLANMQNNKMTLLKQADGKLLYLKILFRLSFEMRFINVNSLEYGARELGEIGKMLGGWIKQQKSTE